MIDLIKDKTKHTEKALEISNTRKHKRAVPSVYYTKKAIHIKVLPQTFKEWKKFATDEEITMQGLLEYFICSILDDEDHALALLGQYKEVLKNEGRRVIPSDAEDIMRLIEEGSPLNYD